MNIFAGSASQIIGSTKKPIFPQRACATRRDHATTRGGHATLGMGRASVRRRGTGGGRGKGSDDVDGDGCSSSCRGGGGSGVNGAGFSATSCCTRKGTHLQQPGWAGV